MLDAGRLTCVFLLFLCLPMGPALRLRAATRADAWLRYAPLDEKTVRDRYAEFPAVVVTLGESEVFAAARDELLRGVRGMLGQTLRVETKPVAERMIVLAKFDAARHIAPAVEKLPPPSGDGFWLKTLKVDDRECLFIVSNQDRGVLYGVFALLKKIALEQPATALNEQHSPFVPLRVLCHRDNLDGTLDRCEAGTSIFWEAGHAAKDLQRARDYARLVASVGVNGLAVNVPSAGPRLILDESLPELASIAQAVRPFGLRLYIALNSAVAPAAHGGVTAPTAVAAEDAWRPVVAAIQRAIPDFGGFVLDVDWGPIEDASGQAIEQAARVNALAAAVQPSGGVVFCRTCRCGAADDPTDPQRDPAKAAYDTFHPLDGRFADNVVLQVKHGPMDFQVREPASPLFGGLEKTNLAIELETTQHYLGQQRHLCFLVPMWKESLEFDMQAAPGKTPVKEIVAGKTFSRPLGGFVAHASASRVENWLGHDLALANLYGFGRLAWDPNLDGKAIAEEWTRQTFGHDARVVGTLMEMLLKSWRIYENYTGPLGAGTLTDLGEVHYGPGIESSSPVAWGPWHGANATGVGKDRTAATGTGFIAQYRPGVAERFESLDTCPDALLLFMHHVPYTHSLDSGKTTIQHIYDAHYQGARDAARLVDQWRSLAGRIDDERYRAVLARLLYQAGHALVWRDAVCNWFLHKSGVADNEGRVGNHPNRFEAESLDHEGYQPLHVTPWETASGGQCAELAESSGRGAIRMKYAGQPGWCHIGVAYFDENDGVSKFRLLVAGQVVDEWTADDTLPDNKPNGHTSTRRETSRVALRTDDEIRIEATAEGGERAAIDYLEITPAAN